MMNSTILIAIISGLCTAIPCIISTFVSNSTREALQSERLNSMAKKIDDLNNKVDKLSDFDKRLSLLEQTVDRLLDNAKGGHTHND